jgi:hypothetical protein
MSEVINLLLYNIKFHISEGNGFWLEDLEHVLFKSILNHFVLEISNSVMQNPMLNAHIIFR